MARARMPRRAKQIQRTGNAMLRGGGANVAPQDRGSWQSTAPASSNPYFYANYFLRWQEWYRWYMTAWEAKKIVDIPVNDAFRVPFKLKGIDQADSTVLRKGWDDLQGERQFRRSCKQQRLLGGCALYIGVADARMVQDTTAKPLTIEHLDGVADGLRCLNLVDANRIVLPAMQNDPLAEDYEKHEHYLVDGRQVHTSRLIVFDGELILNRQNLNILQGYRINPAGFAESVLAPLYDILVRVTGTQEGAYHLVNMASVLLATVKDLKILETTKNGEKTLAALQQILQSINLYRGAIIEGNDAEIKQHSASFGSVPELLMVFLQILSAASDIPATRFLGQAPGGLNATGEADLENYYNSIDEWQRGILRPRMLKVFDILGVCKFGAQKWAKMRAKFDVEFPPLWNMDEAEQAKLAKDLVDAFKPLYDSGIMTAQQLGEELKARNVFVTDVQLQDMLEDETEEEPPIDPKGKLAELAEQEKGGKAKGKSQVQNAKWEEGKHPRAEDGKFGAGSGQHGSSQGESAQPDGIGSLFDRATKEGAAGQEGIDYRPVDEAEAKRIKEATGLDVSGTVHSINEQEIRHAMNEHGEGSETRGGQVPITRADIEAAPELIKTADSIKLEGKTKLGLDVIRYQKRVNGHVVVLEEYRTGKRRLAFKTMWKYKAG